MKCRVSSPVVLCARQRAARRRAVAAGASEENGAEDEAAETALLMDIFEAEDEVEADAASSAFSEGAWFQRAEGDVRDVLSSRLAPTEPLLEFERRIFHAYGLLRIRQLECGQDLVQRTLARARLENAARSDARGELAYYHGRVQDELNHAHGEDSASLELPLELLGELPSGAGNANSGVRAMVAGPTSVRNVPPPPTEALRSDSAGRRRALEERKRRGYA